MKDKLVRNIHGAICAGLVLIAVFVFFTSMYPSVPFDADDWYYLSGFPVSPVPIPHPGVWNPTRILPEHLMPIAGYFSAYIVYPLTGDYLHSFAITTALLISLFMTALYISLYRLFKALSKDKKACALTGLLTIALCFALFRSKPSNNLHLFIAHSLNLHYFYTLPNILNSIVVCILFRLYLTGKLSFGSIRGNAPLLIILLYFSILSMLFSAITLLAFAVSVLMYNLRDSLIHRNEKFALRLRGFLKDSVKHNNIAVVSVLGMLLAIVAESVGGRANWDSGITYSESIFSAGFLSRVISASGSLLGLFPTMSLFVLAVAAVIICLSAGACHLCRKRDKLSLFSKVISVTLVSVVFSFLFVILVSAKGGIQYAGGIRGTYSVFFFLVLLISLACLYIHTKIPLARMFYPLLSVIVILVAVNTRWPYAFPYGRTYTQAALTKSFIEATVEADRNNEPVVELRVPVYSTEGNWPIPISSWGDIFSNTLNRHNITSKKIEVVLIPDMSLPAP